MVGFRVTFSVEANLKIQNILHGKGGQAFQGSGSGVTTDAFAQLGNLYRLGFVCFLCLTPFQGLRLRWRPRCELYQVQLWFLGGSPRGLVSWAVAGAGC